LCKGTPNGGDGGKFRQQKKRKCSPKLSRGKGGGYTHNWEVKKRKKRKKKGGDR